MNFRKSLKDKYILLLGLILWILFFLPLALLIFVPLGILRLIVHYLAKCFKPDLIPLTNIVDSLIIFNPSTACMSVNTAQIWKLQGKLEVSRVREHFYKEFLSTADLREKYRNLYCYYVQWMGYCFKKPVETIVLEDHIREYKLKDGETLDGFIGRWIPIIENGLKKPHWEMLVIHNDKKADNDKTGGNEEDSWDSVFLFKICHGLVDGYSFVHCVEKLSGIKAPYIVTKDELSTWDKMRYILTFPYHGISYLSKFLRTEADPLQPMHNTDSDWMISFTTLDLDRIKNIRRKTKTHFNTVCGMLQVGALKRHLIESGKVTSAKDLPEYTWLPMAKAMPKHPAMTGGGLTNHATAGYTKFPFRTEDRLQALLDAEKDHLDFVDVGLEKSGHWILLKFVWALPAPIQRLGLRIMTRSRWAWSPPHLLSPLMCSNEPYTLLGHPVDHLYLPVLLRDGFPGIGIYNIPVSHSGILDVSVNGSNKVFKSQEDLDRFTKVYLAEEVELLYKACDGFDPSV